MTKEFEKTLADFEAHNKRFYHAQIVPARLLAALRRCRCQRNNALNDYINMEIPASGKEIEEMKQEDDFELLKILRGDL